MASAAQAAMEVQTTRISHGVRAWYVETTSVPVVDIQLTFEGAGYASDPAGKEGRAALAAAMLNEGAGDLDALAFQRALDDGAIQFSAVSSADHLAIHLHCLRDQAKRGGELLALALAKPQFAAPALARVKTELTAQLAQMHETPNYQVARAFDRTAFAGHPYANPPYGTASAIATLSAEDLRSYLTTYATRGNVRIAAAGDVDSALLDAVLEPVVEALRDGDAATPIAAVALQGGGTVVRQPMAVPQTVVQFALPAVGRDDPKFYAVYLLNHILGGNGLVSRLADRVRQQKGLVYGIDTDFDIRRGIPLLRGEFAARNAMASEAMAEAKHTIAELRDKGATTDECADAKAYVIGSNALRLDSSSNIASTLMMMQIHHLGEDYLEKREAYFNAVSCADINAAAKEFLDPAKLLMVTVGGGAGDAATP